MRVLVVGGTGLTGPYIVRRLTDDGHEVVLFHRGETEVETPPQVRHVHSPAAGMPIRSYPDEILAFRPDVVLHMMLVGREDAQAAVDAFRGVAGLLVAISSADVYRAYDVIWRREPGPPDPVPMNEDAPLRTRLYPDHPDYDKILVERVVMAQPDLPGTVLRYPMVYGPRTYRLWDAVQRMADGRPFILLAEGEAEWRGCWGYAENMALAAVLAVTSPRAAGRIYHVAEPEAPPLAEWVRRIGDAAGWDGRIVVLPRQIMPAHLLADLNWEQHWALDSDRIRVELSYGEAVPLDEGLRQTVEWLYGAPTPSDGPFARPLDYAAEDDALAQAERQGLA